MSTYRTAIMIFGAMFLTREDAVIFCRDKFDDDYIQPDVLGLEYFGDCWILGYQMKPGETVDKYKLMWDAHGFDASVEPRAMMDIRTH